MDSLLAARLEAGDDRALAEVFDALGRPCMRRRFGSCATRPRRTWSRTSSSTCGAIPGASTRPSAACAPTSPSARGTARRTCSGAPARADREVRYERRLPSPGPAVPREQVAEKETAAAVTGRVRRLPPDQRQAVELAYFGGLSYRGVAAAGLPEGTAKSRVRLALAKLGTSWTAGCWSRHDRRPGFAARACAIACWRPPARPARPAGRCPRFR